MKNIKPLLKGLIICLFYISLLFFTAGCNPIPPPTANPKTQPASTTLKSEHPTLVQRTLEATIKISPTASYTPISSLEISADEMRGALVIFWHPWNGPLGEIIQDLVEEFNLNNPWRIIVAPLAHSGYDDLGEALQTKLKTSEAPQVAVGLNHQMAIWDLKQRLINLNTYLEDTEWGLSAEEQADFYPVFWDQGLFDGRRVGLPIFRSAQTLFYNQTWGKELGFQAPPTSSAQFRQQVCAAAQANNSDAVSANDGTGGWIISTSYTTLLSWIYAFGGDPVISSAAQTGETVYRFNSSAINEAFSFLRELFDSGCAWQTQNPVPDQPFAQRLGLVTAGSLLDIPFQVEALRSTGSQDQWTVLPYTPHHLKPAITAYGPSFSIIPSSPERQLAAWLFIRWMSSPENNARLVEASGGFPARASTLNHLEIYKNRNPQWAAALDLIQYARVEPAIGSWGQVRRALGDAATQLFRPYFSIDQIPTMLDYLETFAAELHSSQDLKDFYATSTSMPETEALPMRTSRPDPTFSPAPTSKLTGISTGKHIDINSPTTSAVHVP